jgi:hypothetical protein
MRNKNVDVSHIDMATTNNEGGLLVQDSCKTQSTENILPGTPGYDLMEDGLGI